MKKVDQKLFVELIKLWLELEAECAAPNVWDELTFEAVVAAGGHPLKAQKLAHIAFQLANEVAEEMMARLEANIR